MLAYLALAITAGQLTIAAHESFDRFGLHPYPDVMIVSESSERLEYNEKARAVLYSTGREELIIRRWLDTGAVDVIDHEAAHIRTWREHGPSGGGAHNGAWRKICLAHSINRRACKRKL